MGKGGNIERNQTLVTHPVHPSLPLFHPIFLFPIFSLPHAPPSPRATVDVVFGQQALDSQRVLILHCLPQALVLQGSKQDMGCREREDTLKKPKNNGHINRKFVLKGFFHEAQKGFRRTKNQTECDRTHKPNHESESDSRK